MASIDLVIPVFNEELTLKTQVERAIEAIEQSFVGFDWQLIIADNGSKDRTSEVAKEVADFNDRVSYTVLPSKGVGLALDLAWSESKADYMGYFDLDLATHTSHFHEVRQLLNDSNIDLIYGSRLNPKSKVIGRSLIREVTSRGFNHLVKMCFNTKFSDATCGFKFIKKDAYTKIKNTGLNHPGWFFATELLVRAEKLNLNIYELPVTWTDDRESKVEVFSLTIEYLKDMYRLKKKLRSNRW